MNGVLPFADILMDIGFCLPSECCFCANVDSLQHFFAFCPFILQVWEFFRQSLHLPQRQFSSIWGMLNIWWNQKGSSTFTQCCTLLPIFICWNTWKLRCNIIYEETKSWSCTTLISQVLYDMHGAALFPFSWSSQADCLLLSKGILPSLTPARKCNLLPITWKLPQSTSFKLNIDGSSLGNPGPSGAGVVLRNCWGGSNCCRVSFHWDCYQCLCRNKGLIIWTTTVHSPWICRSSCGIRFSYPFAILGQSSKLALASFS